jgi:hypothetical protein
MKHRCGKLLSTGGTIVTRLRACRACGSGRHVQPDESREDRDPDKANASWQRGDADAQELLDTVFGRRLPTPDELLRK